MEEEGYRRPRELLTHALLHLEEAGRADVKTAFCLVDDAVELMLKIAFGARKKTPFPVLVTAAKLRFGEYIDFNDIERFHALRNEFRHSVLNGSGVEIPVSEYFACALNLYECVFGCGFEKFYSPEYQELVSSFSVELGRLEKHIFGRFKGHPTLYHSSNALRYLESERVVCPGTFKKFDWFYDIQRRLIRADADIPAAAYLRQLVPELKAFVDYIINVT